MPFVVDGKGAIVQKGICYLHVIVQLEWMLLVWVVVVVVVVVEVVLMVVVVEGYYFQQLQSLACSLAYSVHPSLGHCSLQAYLVVLMLSVVEFVKPSLVLEKNVAAVAWVVLDYQQLEPI